MLVLIWRFTSAWRFWISLKLLNDMEVVNHLEWDSGFGHLKIYVKKSIFGKIKDSLRE